MTQPRIPGTTGSRGAGCLQTSVARRRKPWLASKPCHPKSVAGGVMIETGQKLRGRGTAENPRPRFLPLTVLRDPDVDFDPADDVAPATQFFRDASRTVIARNDSPDVGFEFSLNPYRGCEHGCIYCYARPTHEYLDMSAGLDFETKIMVKEDAPQLLRAALSKKSWQPRTVSIGGVTDPYQPVERRL